MKERLLAIVKRETVLLVAVAAAAASCFAIPPDGEYVGYFDMQTILLLFCLMAVTAGLQRAGLFRAVGNALLRNVRSSRALAAILVLLCFVSSMLVTNDVALITFVPFGLFLMQVAGWEGRVCLTVTLMTVAANLGSMLTPIGNPQNLYLFTASGLSIPAFLRITLPYVLLAALLLTGAIVVFYRRETVQAVEWKAGKTDGRRLPIYTLLFAGCVASAAGAVPALVLAPVVLVVMLLLDRRALTQVDYGLLLTFLALFVFTGNMGRIAVLHTFLESTLAGREMLVAVGASQIISNVPAALLLSGFTEHWRALIVGTNLGGLGTLIASMASLISYKQLAIRHPEKKKKYLLVFTLVNVAFLVVLILAACILE